MIKLLARCPIQIHIETNKISSTTTGSTGLTFLRRPSGPTSRLKVTPSGADHAWDGDTESLFKVDMAVQLGDRHINFEKRLHLDPRHARRTRLHCATVARRLAAQQMVGANSGRQNTPYIAEIS